MDTNQSFDGCTPGAHGGQPDRVLLFVPGSMQAIHDQSIGLVARQTAAALNDAAGRHAYQPTKIETLGLPTGRGIQACTLAHRTDPTRNVVVAVANYTDMLSARLANSGPTLKFLRLAIFFVAYTPMALRVLWMTPRAGHTNLTREQTLFAAFCYLSVLGGFVAAILALAKLVSVDPAHYVSFSVILWGLLALGLLPPASLAAVLATGNEYYGLMRYLTTAERRADIGEYLGDVHEELRRLYPSIPLHVACFSFGCVVYFDYLARDRSAVRGDAPKLAGLTFIGFPYILVETCVPRYFAGRSWPAERVPRWWNYYIANDFLGSRICEHVRDIFRPGVSGAAAIPLVEQVVAPQRDPGLRWLPTTQHFAYWNPSAGTACDAFQHLVATLLAPDGTA